MRLTVLGVTLGIFLLAGCSPYRPELRQGQFLKPEDVERVTEGMDRTEVLDILGSPLVADVFNAGRWDYVHVTYDDNHNITSRSVVTIFFVDDKVDQIESEIAEEQSFNQSITMEREKPGRVRAWFKSIGTKISGTRDRDEEEVEEVEASEEEAGEESE